MATLVSAKSPLLVGERVTYRSSYAGRSGCYSGTVTRVYRTRFDMQTSRGPMECIPQSKIVARRSVGCTDARKATV